MNSVPNEVNSSDVDALQALRSLPLPEGMQDRITERVRQRQLESPQLGLRCYARELWLGASIAVVAAAVILGIVALQAHRTASPLVSANVPPRTVVLTPAAANTQSAANSLRKLVHNYRARQAALIPHTPPPLPLTSQERLLLALANTPSLAAGAAVSQPVPDHGLGANSLFDLDHEQLKPMQPEPLESAPLPPAPSNPLSSGENQ
jgi:hypothetical protein